MRPGEELGHRAPNLWQALQVGELHLPAQPLGGGGKAKLPVIGGAEGVQVGEGIALIIHLPQGQLHAGPYSPAPALGRQGGDPAHAAHFQYMAVKAHLLIVLLIGRGFLQLLLLLEGPLKGHSHGTAGLPVFGGI